MHVSMLGNSYQYAFAPAQGMSGTLRANGRGYVCGLGATELVPIPPSQLTSEQSAQVMQYMNEHPGSTQALAEIELGFIVGGSGSTGTRDIDWTKVNQNASSFIDAGTKAGLSIAQIIAAIQGRLPQTPDNQAAIKSLSMKQYIPWAIGGAAVLIGLFLVMGTRRRR